MIKFGSTEIVAYPKGFQVTLLDLDSEESIRTADGSLNRDRVAVKRQLDLEFGVLKASEIASILTAVSDVFFNVTYPDPMLGADSTKTFYVGNRVAPVAVFQADGSVKWKDLKLTLTER